MMLHTLCLLLILILLAGCASPGRNSDGSVDMLDYLLQTDDVREQWTIGGVDVRQGIDPDGTEIPTFILNKWSTPLSYEVFKVTDTQVQLRYEVVRLSGAAGAGNWIRRFEEIDGEGPAPGGLWVNRRMVPGGPGVLSRYRQDHFIFDESTRSYMIDPQRSGPEFQSYISVEWARNDWGDRNRTGFELNPVLRLVSQWQQDGRIFETYDYSRGKGLVSWRWLERVNTLPPLAGDESGRVFHCEEGQVYVESPGDAEQLPVVFKYDPHTGRRGRRLEVVRFTSHWRPQLGPQWYVVYRDLSVESPLEKKMERIKHDFSLPEWRARPGATLSDLPHVHTHPPDQQE